MSYTNSSRDEVLRVIPDEIRIYLDDSLGFALVRGEVISKFTKETYIRGPIELAFERVERLLPYTSNSIVLKKIFQYLTDCVYSELNGTALPIVSKYQVTSISIPPPTSQGIIPAGTQRFPFEFPIPTTLTPTIIVKGRLEVEYQLAATLHLSSQQPNDEKSRSSWIDFARYNKKKIVAYTYMRVIKAMESNKASITNQQQPPAPQVEVPPIVPNNSNTGSEPLVTTQPLWSRRGLDDYQSTHDLQHDQLAFSLAGRSIGNITQPQDMDKVHGVRYKIGIDRTAIALGTSINVDVMLEPTKKNVVVKSILFKISERRRYTMKVNTSSIWGTKETETRLDAEKATMVLKWAESYSVDSDELMLEPTYVRPCHSDSRYLIHFEPPYPGYFKTKMASACHKESDDLLSDNESDFSDCYTKNTRGLVNLKEMSEVVRVGQFFGGRFKMPVPDCLNLLHPSMCSDSINIDHWLKLVVTVECEGETFDLALNTPGRLIDCRLVNLDDECQTLLPPPPSYESNDVADFPWLNWTTYSFWQQREPITMKNEWGICMPCPCEVKQERAMDKSATGNNENSRTNVSNWGAPPCYSES